MTATVRWDLRLTALSSLSHKDADTGTTTALFRREKVIQPDGVEELVPIMSGNSFRGVLRRIGEELMREVLDYEGRLPLATAHLLRSGGALRKTSGEPLSGRRVEEARRLVPQFAVFGGAACGAIHKGGLQVGKLVPRVTETAAILTQPHQGPLRSQLEVLGLESYSRLDDAQDPGFPAAAAATAAAVDSTALMRFEVETLAAGTELESWVRLDRMTDLQIAFFGDVLDRFRGDGRLGGRQAIGHGRVKTLATRTVLAGEDPAAADWREEMRAERDLVMDALTDLGR